MAEILNERHEFGACRRNVIFALEHFYFHSVGAAGQEGLSKSNRGRPAVSYISDRLHNSLSNWGKAR